MKFLLASLNDKVPATALCELFLLQLEQFRQSLNPSLCTLLRPDFAQYRSETVSLNLKHFFPISLHLLASES